MPLAGYRCPADVPSAGEIHPVAFCLGECPHPCVAPPLLAAIYQAESTNHHTGAYISSSMLAGSECPRQTVYERQYEFYDVPRRRFWPFRGTHAHTIVERAAPLIAPLGWLQELRMAVDFEYPEIPQPVLRKGKFTGKWNDKRCLKITVGGTTDCYNPVLRQMWDMKSMKEQKAVSMITGVTPKWMTDVVHTYSPHLDDSWVKQLNIYRLLLSKTPMPDEIKATFGLEGDYYPAPEQLGIQCISMMDIPRTGAPYTVRERYEQVTYYIDEVPVWSLDDAETYVRAEALKWYRWLVLEEPTPVAKKEWVCRSCPFNAELYPDTGICYPTTERERLQA